MSKPKPCYIDRYRYVKRKYKRKYRATLAPTKDNIDKAFEVYKYGWQNRLGVKTASQHFYEKTKNLPRPQRYPIYTRMANFLRETKLWNRKEDRWNFIYCQYTLSYKYDSRRHGPMRMRVTITIPIPIETTVNTDLARIRAENALRYIGFPPELIEAAEPYGSRWGAQIIQTKPDVEIDMKEGRIVIPFDAEVLIRGKLYTYRIRVTYTWEQWLSLISE